MLVSEMPVLGYSVVVVRFEQLLLLLVFCGCLDVVTAGSDEVFLMMRKGI